MAPRLAWIGLGNMGRGMCKNLVAKGNLSSALILSNRTLSTAHDVSAQFPPGATIVAPSIASAVADADLIFTCLGDDAAITDVMATAVTGDVRGKLFVDCSTVHPDTTAHLAREAEAHGAEFVACPVFGAPPMAEAGQLVCVLAGPEAAVAKVRPYCKGVMGREEIIFADEAPGKALLLKVIGNTMVLNMIESLAEGHTLAEKSGLGTEHLHRFVETMFPGPYTAYSARMRSGDYYLRESPAFSARGGRKDARHAMSIAQSSGTRLKALEVVDAHLAEVETAQGSKGDIAGVYGAVRQESGLPFGNHTEGTSKGT